MIWHSCLAAIWFSINEIKFQQMTTRLETWSQGPLQIFSLGRILWLKNMICPREICGLRICCAYGISIPFFPSIIKRNRNEKTFQLNTKASVFIYSIKQIRILSFSILGTKVEVLFCTILILQILAKTALIHLLGHFVILLHVFFLNFLLFVLLWKFGNNACHQFVFE